MAASFRLPHPDTLRTWKESQVIDWLRKIGFHDCIHAFQQYKINGSKLADLSDADMVRMTAIPIPKRKKIVEYVSACKTRVQPNKPVIGLIRSGGGNNAPKSPPDHWDDNNDDGDWSDDDFTDDDDTDGNATDDDYLKPTGHHPPPGPVEHSVPASMPRPPMPDPVPHRHRAPAEPPEDIPPPPPRQPKFTGPAHKAKPVPKSYNVPVMAPKKEDIGADDGYIIPEDLRGVEPVYDPIGDEDLGEEKSLRKSSAPYRGPPVPPRDTPLETTRPRHTDENQNNKVGALANRFNKMDIISRPPPSNKPERAPKPVTNGNSTSPRNMQENKEQQSTAGRRVSDVAGSPLHQRQPPPLPPLKSETNSSNKHVDDTRPQPPPLPPSRSEPNAPHQRGDRKRSQQMPMENDRPLPPKPPAKIDAGVAARALPPPPLEEEQESLYPYAWYFGNMTKENVETKLHSVGEDGTFLVRKALGGQGNPYTLQFLDKGRIWKLPIRLRPDNKYALGKEKPEEPTFRSVPDLVQHYRKNPVGACRENSRTKSESVLVRPPSH